MTQTATKKERILKMGKVTVPCFKTIFVVQTFYKIPPVRGGKEKPDVLVMHDLLRRIYFWKHLGICKERGLPTPATREGQFASLRPLELRRGFSDWTVLHINQGCRFGWEVGR